MNISPINSFSGLKYINNRNIQPKMNTIYKSGNGCDVVSFSSLNRNTKNYNQYKSETRPCKGLNTKLSPTAALLVVELDKNLNSVIKTANDVNKEGYEIKTEAKNLYEKIKAHEYADVSDIVNIDRNDKCIVFHYGNKGIFAHFDANGNVTKINSYTRNYGQQIYESYRFNADSQEITAYGRNIMTGSIGYKTFIDLSSDVITGANTDLYGNQLSEYYIEFNDNGNVMTGIYKENYGNYKRILNKTEIQRNVYALSSRTSLKGSPKLLDSFSEIVNINS